MSRGERYERYKDVWHSKTLKQVEKELSSYRRYLEKNKDTFFHNVNNEELTDGLRVMALTEIIEKKTNGAKN